MQRVCAVERGLLGGRPVLPSSSSQLVPLVMVNVTAALAHRAVPKIQETIANNNIESEMTIKTNY